GGEFGNGRGPTCPPALTMAGMPLLPTAPGHRQDIRRALLDLILSARTAVAPAAITGAGYSGKKVLETKGAMPALPRRFAGITPPTHDGLRRWSGRAARSRWPENVVVGITANG
ncbi:MAG: hypothetical protein KC441_16850, partial [Anaerolineales bacterium]|nr:hypothetical protein [Anaerolineales bacterium]